MKDAQQTANCLIDEFNDFALYEIATHILYYLEGKGACIWQTYTKDDVKMNTGKKPTMALMSDLQEQLQNFFEYYYNG